MPLVKTLDILKDCEEMKYAVGAFNINGLDQPQALIKRAEQLRSPILMVIPGVIEKYVNFEDYVNVTARAARDTDIPVGIHLSHGLDLEQFERACKAGFTSVMYDGSKFPYEENVANTRIAVEIGHKYGCAVEGELGALGSSFASVSESMTDPAMARDFVEKTGVDILAVAIGNAHGFYKGTPSLDFKRLEEIRYALMAKNCYLTLHGGTGIPEDHIKRSIEIGIVKICIYTEMCHVGKRNAIKYVEEHPEYTGNYDICDLIGSIDTGFADAAEESMRWFMSVGKIGRGNSTFAALDAPAVSKQPVSASFGGGSAAPAAAQADAQPIVTDPGPKYPSLPAENNSFRATGDFWNKNV